MTLGSFQKLDLLATQLKYPYSRRRELGAMYMAHIYFTLNSSIFLKTDVNRGIRGGKQLGREEKIEPMIGISSLIRLPIHQNSSNHFVAGGSKYLIHRCKVALKIKRREARNGRKVSILINNSLSISVSRFRRN